MTARAAWPGLILAFLLAAGAGCMKDVSVNPRADAGDTDSSSASDADTDADSDADADSDTDTDSDTSSDSDSGEDTGTGSGGACAGLDVIIAMDGAAADHLHGAMRSRFADAIGSLGDIGDGVDEVRVAVIDGCPQPAAYHNWGASGDCSFAGDANWLSSADGDFDTAFECVMDLAVGGGYDGGVDSCSGGDQSAQPARAAAASVDEASNDGFLRDDALLLVLALTDTDESFFGGDAASIRTALVDAKGSDDRVVFVGFGGEAEINMIDPDCDSAYDLPDQEYDVEDSVNMRATAEGFGANGLYATLCHNGPHGAADPIGDALGAAASRLDTLCAAF